MPYALGGPGAPGRAADVPAIAIPVQASAIRSEEHRTFGGV
jgi:hypothetical protein